MAAALTTSDSERLAELCGVVRKGLETFVEVGRALKEIREGRLYRARCSTFEAFVQIEFGVSRSYAYEQIAAAETVGLLMSGVPDIPVPESAAQVRPLTALPPEQQPEAWKEAVESAKAEGKRVTAEHVKRAAEVRRSIKHEKPEDAAAAIVASTVRSEEPEPEFANEQEWVRHEIREARKAVANEPWSKLAAYLERLPLPPKWTREEINAGAPELPSGHVTSARLVHTVLGKIIEAIDKESSSAAA